MNKKNATNGKVAHTQAYCLLSDMTKPFKYKATTKTLGYE